jgi:uncharacterized protein YndB with AHSA1/START domain
MTTQFEVFGKIQRSIEETFDAIYDPQKLSGYFTTGGASAPLDEGTTVMWDFKDHPGAFPVKVIKCDKPTHIELEWGSAEGNGKMNRVLINFISEGPTTTKVTIFESGWSETEAGLKASYGNCMGWSQMLAAMKAHVEYGINLREGFY